MIRKLETAVRVKLNIHGTCDPLGKIVVPFPVIVVCELSSVPLSVAVAPMQIGGAGLLTSVHGGNDSCESDPVPLTPHTQPAASII